MVGVAGLDITTERVRVGESWCGRGDAKGRMAVTKDGSRYNLGLEIIILSRHDAR